MKDIKKPVEAIRKALDACYVGDVPDVPRSLYELMYMDGWRIIHKDELSEIAENVKMLKRSLLNDL